MRSALRAAFALLLAAVACGCATSKVKYLNLDAHNPSIEIAPQGIKLNGEYIDPYEIPKILERFEIPKKRVINIRISDPMQFDGRTAMSLKKLLAMHGYSRTALVTKENAEAWSDSEKAGFIYRVE